MGRDERSNPNAPINNVPRVRTELYDRFGKRIMAGDAIYIINKQDVIWRVAHVRPVMDPKAPPGLVEMAMQAVFLVGLPGGELITDCMKVRDKSEFETAPGLGSDVPPPAEPPIVSSH